MERIKSEIKNLIDEWRWHCSAEAKYRCEAYGELLEFINSLQEEPVSDDLEEAACEYDNSHIDDNNLAFKAGAKWGMEQAEVKIQAQSIAVAHGCPKETVSNDLEEAAKKAGQKYFPNENCIWARPNYEAMAAACAFKEGAQWQKEQFEKNRLEHCDSITEEQYNLECGFIDQYLKKYHRTPTFLDAIEYGMKKQREICYETNN